MSTSRTTAAFASPGIRLPDRSALFAASHRLVRFVNISATRTLHIFFPPASATFHTSLCIPSHATTFSGLFVLLYRRNSVQTSNLATDFHKDLTTMCGPLTVSCFEQSPYEREGHGISHHYITLSELQVPCMRPGSEECKKKSCPLVDFQNPPTACSGKSPVDVSIESPC